MKKKTKIIITALAFVLIFAGVGILVLTESGKLFAPTIAEATPPSESSPAASVSSAAASKEEYVIPPLPLPTKKNKTAGGKPVEDETIVTENPDGSTNTEIVRHDFSKPEPPPPPKIDEAQRSDPTKEPEYTEEQLRPNENPPQNNGGTNGGGTTPNKPNTPDTPTGGETNNKGQVYVPGFGWITPSKVQTEVAENAGWEDSPVIGY